VLSMVEALVGCVAGAVPVSDTKRMAHEVGLAEIVLNAKPQYVEAMTGFEDPLYQKIVALLPAGSKPADYLVSLEVQARKPAGEIIGSQDCKTEGGIYNPLVGELVAIGAAIAVNCEPCLKYHYGQANMLGISRADMAQTGLIFARVPARSGHLRFPHSDKAAWVLLIVDAGL